MRLLIPSILLALALIFSSGANVRAAGTTAPTLNNAPGSFANLVDNLLPAVVNISSTQKMSETHDEELPEMPQFPPGSPFEDFFHDFMDRRGDGAPAIPPASLGSGFVVDAAQGYIVTNNHVIKDAEDVRVTFHDDSTLPAKIIGYDEKTDIALLQVKTEKKLTAVTFGNSDVLRVGDWVVAIGNPFGLGGTVTAGIVSARQRDINAGPYDDFIQTDASINRGNSGGPMFDLNGKVIGINTAIFSPSGGSVGIGFAIPSSLAKPVVDQLIQFGRTKRGWMGVRIQSVTEEIAESLGLKQTHGALIASVTPKGPAEEAGIEPGDVITKFNGQDINQMRNLPRAVAEAPIDSTATITYWRDGKETTTKVKIGELEKAEKDGLVAAGTSEEPSKDKDVPGTAVKSVGVTLLALTDTLRQDYNVPSSVNGVVVDSVDDLSEAAQKGILPGDVLVEINQQAVTDPEKARDVFIQAAQAGRTSVLLLINREGDVRFVAVRLDSEKIRDDKKVKPEKTSTQPGDEPAAPKNDAPVEDAPAAKE